MIVASRENAIAQITRGTYNAVYDEIEAEIKGSAAVMSLAEKVGVVARVMQEKGLDPAKYRVTFRHFAQYFGKKVL
jgi:hypothetical protein